MKRLIILVFLAIFMTSNTIIAEEITSLSHGDEDDSIISDTLVPTNTDTSDELLDEENIDPTNTELSTETNAEFQDLEETQDTDTSAEGEENIDCDDSQSTEYIEPESSSDISKDFDYIYKDGHISITAYNGNSKKVSIPSNINGMQVSSIADEAFSGSNIEEVNLPDRIYHIGDAAFRDCEELIYINLPSSIESIGNEAFDNCTSLTAFVSEYSFAYGYCMEKNIQYQCISDTEY